MTTKFSDILETLNRHRVDYIVVGGVAAVIHGAPTTTFDLDALIRVSEENARRLTFALEELKARYREHPQTLRPTEQDIMAGGHLLLMTRSGPLDVLGFIGDSNRYEDLLRASTEIEMDLGRIRVLNLDELIRQKTKTNRPKDKAMLEMLMTLAERMNSKE